MKRFSIPAILLVFATGAFGCGQSGEGGANASPLARFQKSGPEVPAGTALTVRMTTPVSSETARAGDTWEGTITSSVIVGERILVPAGTPVRGVVKDALGAKKGNRAMLEVAVTSLELDGRPLTLNAATEPVIAGSPRARNLGAIAGGAAAGALIGKAVGGDGDDAAKGAIIGGAAATVGVAASKGYQVVLKSGTELEFVVH
jgi:hypothetical protein